MQAHGPETWGPVPKRTDHLAFCRDATCHFRGCMIMFRVGVMCR